MSNYRTYGYQHQTRFERSSDCFGPCETAPECCGISPLPKTVSVAMAYIPFQDCNDVYQCDKALCAGTIFPVLDKPFLAGCC
ncbi:MAG: spore coat associated protein CotJA [Clostridia bacterium]|nr:spore coat associated protein CotJA [Clostridia bacterium]